jgi:hypothetical protein
MTRSIIMKRILAVVALLALAWLIVLPFWGLIVGQEKKPDQFAADRVPEGEGKPVAFDGKRAMGYLKAVCDIGPRMSGTPGMKKQQELIRKHYEDLGYKVRAQAFEGKQNSQTHDVAMTNLIVPFFPDREKRVILCTHYDTRPIADQEPDEKKWREPFVSANDGGSGVALLMELAHHMKDLPSKVGVDFVMFDGEEYVFNKSDKYFFGSEHFAQAWKKQKDRPEYLAAVLMDMIAGKKVRFPVEGYSWQRAEGLCRELWGIAKEHRCFAFPEQVADYSVQDDHLALLNVGIPAVDLIDFSYPHWHRLTDTPANCAPDGMEQVATVLSVWLQRVK